MHQLMKKHLVLAALITSSSCLVSYSLCAADVVETSTHEAGSKISRAADSSRQFADDLAITTTVKAKLIRDELTKARHITVETDKGIVTLSGSVDSAGELQEVAAVARSVEGVQSIKNELKLKTP